MWFFPAILAAAIFASFINVVQEPSILSFGILIFLIYLLPPLLFRVINFFFPIQEGMHKLGPEHPPSPWMISLRIQLIYAVIPQFEALLNTLPGIYSVWLRLWGSKVGRMVFWAPDVKILDRGHLEIGSRCYIGSSTFSCHLGNPKDGETELCFRKIIIEDDVFIPAQCNIGPGAHVKKNEKLRIMTQILGSARKELV